MGFQHGAINDTSLSYPSLIAEALGTELFESPTFFEQGGLPLNLETLVKGVEDTFGTDIGWNHTLSLSNYILETLIRIKNYWESQHEKERGKGNGLMPFTNQSLFSATVSDALLLTSEDCDQVLEEKTVAVSPLSVLPQNAFYLAGKRVLNPRNTYSLAKQTLLENVRLLSNDGGIDHLIVFLGANNLVGAITELRIEEATEADLQKLPFERTATVYNPELFKKVYRKLATELSKMNIGTIYTATIPDFTQVPLIQRITYSDQEQYYTHVWVRKEDFDPEIHPWLTNEEIKKLHKYVVEYNAIIQATAREFGWKVLDLHQFVDDLHHGRFDSVPVAAKRVLRSNPWTRHLVMEDGTLRLTTEYAQVNPYSGKLEKGGIFSLDGMHPSTFAYGLIASGFIQLMKKNGARFKRELNWERIVAHDALLVEPPVLINELLYLLQLISADYAKLFSKFGQHVFNQLTQIISGKKPEQNTK
jgi:hypothetical protein